MGQLCSSDQIQHDHRNSQNLQRKKTDFTLPHPNTDDHYSQGNIQVPPAPLHADENDHENDSKLQYCPETGQTPSQYIQYDKTRFVVVKTDEFCQQEQSEQQQNWAKLSRGYEENKTGVERISKRKQEKMKEKCPICQETYETLYEKPVFAICRHSFCSRCLQETLKIQPYCPICYTYQSESLCNAKGEQIYEAKEGAPVGSLNKALWNLDFVRTVVGDEVNKEARHVYW